MFKTLLFKTAVLILILAGILSVTSRNPVGNAGAQSSVVAGR